MKDRVSRYDMLMMMANVVSLRATCTRSQVGVIVALDSRPLVSGYNGAPSKMPHCDHTCKCKDTTPTEFSWDPSGHTATCPANPSRGCDLVVHAEANAIAFAAREGVMLWTAVLFTTMAPCYNCAQLIINAGIVEVVYDKTYRDSSGLALLEQAGVRICQHTA